MTNHLFFLFCQDFFNNLTLFITLNNITLQNITVSEFFCDCASLYFWTLITLKKWIFFDTDSADFGGLDLLWLFVMNEG